MTLLERTVDAKSAGTRQKLFHHEHFSFKFLLPAELDECCPEVTNNTLKEKIFLKTSQNRFPDF
jgi:hypothetical protein